MKLCLCMVGETMSNRSASKQIYVCECTLSKYSFVTVDCF